MTSPREENTVLKCGSFVDISLWHRGDICHNQQRFPAGITRGFFGVSLIRDTGKQCLVLRDKVGECGRLWLVLRDRP